MNNAQQGGQPKTTDRGAQQQQAAAGAVTRMDAIRATTGAIAQGWRGHLKLNGAACKPRR